VTLALYVLGALLLAVLSGLVAVGLLMWEDRARDQMSEAWMRAKGWWWIR
jgi:hypothetical protein